MPAIVPAARRLLETGLAALFPADCLVCYRPLPWRQRGSVCHPCWASLPWTPGLRLSRGPLRALLWAGDYSGPLRRLIHDLKFRGVDYLGSPLGKEAAGRLGPLLAAISLPRPDCVVPVPLHWWRRSRRGYNQAEIIATTFARSIGLPLVSRILQRHRAGRRQLGLTRGERLRSLDRCFRVRRDALRRAGRAGIGAPTILLLDDVVTTGATLDACAAALREAGAGAIIGCALARTHSGVMLRKDGS